MAKSIIQRIVTAFDRNASKKAEREMEEALGKAGAKGGDKAGKGFLKELRAEFNKRKAKLQEELAKGTIDQKEFKKQTKIAAKTFNDGLLKGIEQARKQGKLTDREYVKLTRSLKRVGDEGQHSIGGRLVDGLKKAALAAAALFGLNQIRRFGMEALRAGQEIAKGQKQLQVVLRNTGTAWEDVREEIQATANALWETHRLTAGEVDVALKELVQTTGDYGLSLDNVALAADVAAGTNSTLEKAAQRVGRALQGDIGWMKRFGLEAENSTEAVALLTERFSGLAKESLTPTQVLGKAWEDLKEQVGLTLMEAGEGASVFDTLTGSVRALTEALAQNTDGFVKFFNLGLRPVIRGVGVLYRAVVGVAEILVGVFFGVIATGAHGLGLFAEAAGLAAKGVALMLRTLSPQAAAQVDRFGDSIRANAKAIREFAEAAAAVGRESIISGLFPETPDRTTAPSTGEGRSPRTGTTPRTGTAGAESSPAAETDAEAEALARLEAQRDAHVQSLAREIEVQGRRAEAYRRGEEAVEALNRQLHIEDAVLASGAEAGSEYAQTIERLAAAQYDAAQATEAAAEAFSSPWNDALDAFEERAGALTSLMQGLGMALAEGGIGGLAKFASMKAKEALAMALGAAARGIAALAMPLVAAAKGESAPGHFAAAAKFGAEAAAWQALGGAAGGGGGIGGASGAAGAGFGGPTASAPPFGEAARAQPKGDEIHVYIDPFNADNPVHQRQVGRAVQQVAQRHGKQPIIHRGNGGNGK